jgi:hypothetical protein
MSQPLHSLDPRLNETPPTEDAIAFLQGRIGEEEFLKLPSEEDRSRNLLFWQQGNQRPQHPKP